jgi:hypothetical protein
MAYAYSGVWRGGSDPYYLWVNADWNNFQAKWQQLSAQNLRLVDLDTVGFGSGNQRLWSGVWRAGSDAHYLWVNADWNNFQAKWQQLSAQNLRLTVLKTYNVASVPWQTDRRWAGVWRAGSDAHYLWVNADWNSFQSKWQQLSAQNLRLVDLETYGGLWAGAWRAGSDAHYLWVNADWNSFQAKWQQLSAQNLRLTVFKSYVVNNQRLFAGVWRAGADPYYLWVNASLDNFLAKWQELGAQNLRLINLEMWSAGLVPTVRLHVKVLTNPNVPINTMVTRMREVYESAGIQVQLASTENLNLPALNDCDVGGCFMGQTTAEQNQLFNNRNNVGQNEVVVYFVRSTVPPFNGCAAHPSGRPGAVVAQGATQWTLGHEFGHVLGLSHVNDNNRLMTGNGTSNITNPPPDLIASEIQTMKNSPFTIDL